MMNFQYSLDPKQASIFDQEDRLASYREQFSFPRDDHGQEFLYFCGNSLGLMPKKARTYVNDELDAWEKLAVNGHFKKNHPWFAYHEFVTDGLAHIMGAMPSEVVAMNSLSTNMHLLMASFFRPQGQRRCIMIEKSAFPSDYYGVRSQLRFHGLDPYQDLIELIPRSGEHTLRTEDILAKIEQYKDELALVWIGGVQYLTGQAFAFSDIAAAAHRAGAMVGFDMAHGAGNLQLKLHDDNVDFAVWCHYKYLNGGAGTIGGAFVHERHLGQKNIARFEGWWGNDKAERFKMSPDFNPIPTVEAWQLSNPPILQLAALRASVELFQSASMPALRKKSLHLTGYLEFLLKNMPGPKVEIITPQDPEQRGAQLSLRIGENAKGYRTRLEQQHIISDFREPDVVRVAPAPLYNSYSDVYKLVECIKGMEAKGF